ncbi:MAG: cobalt ECF transporter T component CbiQ [Desulfovibrio sp.]|nr:cobalt ECF transporter T component CbiQ [Desulfovibrio sp.]
MPFLHSLDPRLRLIVALLYSVCTALCSAFLPLALMGLIALVFLFLARPKLKDLLQRLLTVNTFVLFLWLITPFTTPGPSLWTLGPLTASQPGVTLAVLVTVKANILTAFFIALLGGMSISTLGHALEVLHLPRKLIFLLLFTERSFYLLQSQWQSMQQAAKLRGFVARTNLRSYLTIAQLLGILLIRSLDHAQKAREALLLRGFAGRIRSLEILRCKCQDLVFAGMALIPLVAFFLLEQ